MLKSLYVRVSNWSASDEGEYGILVALIALIIVAGVGLFGTNLNTFFNNIAARVPLGT